MTKLSEITAAIVFLLGAAIQSSAQLVDYPIEVSFNPCGFGNRVPGQNPTFYGSFSSIRMALFKELVASKRYSNSLGIDASVDFYHTISKARDFNPAFTTVSSRSMFFISDIFSIGGELVGNIETIPGINKERNIFDLVNYRGRIRPFLYIVLTPDLILEEIFTIGFSTYADSSLSEVNPGVFGLVSNDYSIFKYEMTAIYLTSFNTRFFLTPYVFSDRYRNITARSADGKPNKNNPPLREDGLGCALGAKYTTVYWGFSEGAIEAEMNRDECFDANSYFKYRLYFKSENKFLTKKFGYSAMVSWAQHFSAKFKEGDQILIGKLSTTSSTGQLGLKECVIDGLFIYNINRYLSIRPEYEYIYRYMSRNNTFKRTQVRMFFHVSY